MREQPRLVGTHPGHLRGDQLIAVSSHRDIPRSDSNGIERSGATLGPEHGSSIAEVPRSVSDHPYQHGEASHSRAAESEQTVVWNQRMRLGLLGVRQRVRSQQLQKRVVALAHLLLKGRKALFQAGICSFRFAYSPLASHANHRQHDTDYRRRSERNQDSQSPSSDAMRREREAVEQEHERDGNRKRRGCKYGCAAQPNTGPQPLLQARNITVELAAVVHASSRCVPR